MLSFIEEKKKKPWDRNEMVIFVTTVLEMYIQYNLYSGCSESNVSCFIMLTHNVRGGCWWYGSGCWTFPTTSHYNFVAVQPKGQSDKMVYGIIARMKQRCGTEFLHEIKIVLTDIHWCLLNVCGDQTADMSTVRWWMVCFGSGNNSMKD